MTKERILKVAQEIFSKKGFDSTTTQEIAERAKVNKAMIHYYFKNKEGLYIEILRKLFSEIASKILNIFSMNLTPPEKFKLLISEYIDFISKNRFLPPLVLRSVLSYKRNIYEIIKEIMLPVYKKGEEVFDEGKRKGYFYDYDYKNLIPTLIGAIIFYFIAHPVFSFIWEDNPLSNENLEKRKNELIKFIEKALIKSTEEK
ncbi:TetR/AcrR family transcriptional regulator [Candidatus Aminicenantes bacterium AC-708-M15]|jgi:AcrR family transcriptional regulator|nr:TetR/AcrR family transcriptional regulator [SCandidatus Aminicenantes bacterium Aminicenantia_JdfR_composite]MCP2604249.1 TetR/AcrR family transcriptional regulator [Candidatus Aminicenantes bacterium AC-708-M15]MCP2618156.1 TetR/AcrR family transcriptional regulator [Candidatus Aminicenantes bacterium AC-335-A11]